MTLQNMKMGNKPSGSVTTFLRFWNKRLENGRVDVPCGQCTACCRSPRVQADLTVDELAAFPDAVHHPELMGSATKWALPKRDDGSCKYLIDDKCSIYNRRPRSCRMYDCRIHLLMGVMDGDDQIMVEAMKQWAPLAFKIPEDRQYFLAAHLALFHGGPPKDQADAIRKFSRLRKYLKKAKQVIEAYTRLTPEQQTEFLRAKL
jgi:Fe-S-cluster containining protein